ncbi:hypothetical protein CL628_04485 [bacterium]|nr:hypothetical protein [bacterium]|tara:strand:+ start:57 stop:362 length:306 start_codon:yes stop_codon:yes gene_type:complete
MQFKLTKKNIELSNHEEGVVDEKLSRIAKHLRTPFVVDVMLRRDTHHQSGDVYLCRINVEEGKRVFHGERTGESTLDALDETIAVVIQQLEKEHDRHRRDK